MNWTLIRFASTSSTQDWIRDWAALNAAEGLAVQALEQQAGRGRQRRSWWSPRGAGLYISVLLRPNIPLAEASQLTMLASLAAIDASVAIAGVRPRAKWPNDLLLADRKLCGVLADIEQDEGHLCYAVVGMGMKINTDFVGTELENYATSLSQVTGTLVDISRVRDAYLETLAQRYRQLLAGHSPFQSWRENLSPLGEKVEVQRPGQLNLQGLAIDVSPEGALLHYRKGCDSIT